MSNQPVLQMCMVVEQTREYQCRIKYEPGSKSFLPTDDLCLFYERNFPYPYGWLKETGTPPGDHLDIILMSLADYQLGDEIVVKVIGCFWRKDGDHKLVGVLPERPVKDIEELTDRELKDLNQVYLPRFPGEGWFGFHKAFKIIKDYLKKKG